MKINQIFLGVLVCVFLVACNSQPTINKENVSNYMKDEKAKEEWSKKTSDAQNEALKELAKFDQLVTTRKKVAMQETSKDTLPDPVMPDNMVAGVEIRLGKTRSSYDGSFKIESIAQNKISGLLNDNSLSNIFYKLPTKKSLPQTKDNAEYALDYYEDVVDGTMTKRILVKDDRSPFLLLLEDGSNKPYNKYFESIDLRIIQGVDTTKNSSSVRIEFQNQPFNLSLGERKIAKSFSGEVEFFLKGATYRRGDSGFEEGLPYFIKLYVYRTR